MTEYEKIQKEIENLNSEIAKQEIKKLKLIEENEIVKEYIQLQENIENKKQEIQKYRRIINYAKMYDCKHIFVVTKKYIRNGEEQNIYQCICCGFTNNVPDGLKEFKSECIKRTRKNSSLLSKEEQDYFEIEKIYKEILLNNPNISREEILKELRDKIKGKTKKIK